MKKLLPLIVLSLLILTSSADLLAAKKELSASNRSSSTIELMRMNVYANNADGSSFWIDGAVTIYGSNYSDSVNGDDGLKMTNPGANVCIQRDNINLAFERRQIIKVTDTTFFRMWGLQKRTYEMRLIGLNLEQQGLKAYLRDNYLHTSTSVQLNDTTHINFEINNDAGSYAIDRFSLVYLTDSAIAMPVPHFVAIDGISAGGSIFLNWITENQKQANEYYVQKSSDGLHFTDVGSVNANNSSTGNYQWTDHYPASEYNYYRIRSIDTSGTNRFSDVVTVKTLFNPKKEIKVFPNPATLSNFNLDMSGQPEGKYEVQLFNSSGNLIIQQSFTKYQSIQSVRLSVHQSLLPGIYHLRIIKPSGEKQLINVIF